MSLLVDYISIFDFVPDNEVHEDCKKMNTYQQTPVLQKDFNSAECYNMGGRVMYGRDISHFGSCAEKIPCSLTSGEKIKIYENVCE